MSTYLINYRVGDIVDIKANAAQQKGMPHKYYHGFVPYFNLPSRTTSLLTFYITAEQASSTTSHHTPLVSSYIKSLGTDTSRSV